MIEERAFRATQFWRQVDADCRSAFDGPDDAYRRTCLHIFFLTTNRGEGAPEVLLGNLFADVIRLEGTRDDAEFSRRWMSLLSVVAEALRAIAAPPDERHVTKELYEVMLRSIRRNLNIELPLSDYFDHRFFAVMSKDLRVNLQGAHFSAVLANALAGHSRTLVDAFCTTGELFATSGRERWRRGKRRTASVIQEVGHLDLEMRMRLSMHSVSPPRPFREQFESDSLANAFIHVDSSQFPRAATPVGTRPRQYDRNVTYATTSIEMLDSLLSQYGAINGTVVVVGKQRNQDPRGLKGLRERLVKSGMLAAVIDFPPIGGPGTRAERTALVLRTSANLSRVLMVNLRALGDLTSNHELGVAAEFAGRLVELFYDAAPSARWATLGSSRDGDRIRGVFEREFSNGYRDVSGLCVAIDRETLTSSGSVLAAGAHLRPPERPTFLSGIDGKPVLNELATSPKSGRTIYIIGNNGEGKSLLLRELAQHASSEARQTVGVSFGATDRFPFESDAEFSRFVYEGARTTADGASGRRSAEKRARKILDIHRNAERLAAFSRALNLMQFHARRFVVPFKEQKRFSELGEISDRVHELTDHSSDEDFFDINVAGMEVAFMRKKASREITPFSELSSGEQQMLALAIKLAAAAEPGCLVLVDEPEVSLHVSWQRLLPSLFREFRERFHCDIVVATHSPLIISSAMPPGDVCFVARRQRLELIPERSLRSVESILFSGFGTHTENNRSVHEGCAALVAEGIRLANMPDCDLRELDHLTNELAEMRRTVLLSKEQIDPGSLSASIELLDKTREALKQLRSWRQDGDHMHEPGGHS